MTLVIIVVIIFMDQCFAIRIGFLQEALVIVEVQRIFTKSLLKGLIVGINIDQYFSLIHFIEIPIFLVHVRIHAQFHSHEVAKHYSDTMHFAIIINALS
jgi:hypothetical protein